MARFIGKVRGGRGEVSRLGTKSSGLSVVANGWNIGARVELSAEGESDAVTVYITGGSNKDGGERCLGTFWSIPKESGDQ